jgi:hypothetical protein
VENLKLPRKPVKAGEDDNVNDQDERRPQRSPSIDGEEV